jgi:hypothetical protein
MNMNVLINEEHFGIKCIFRPLSLITYIKRMRKSVFASLFILTLICFGGCKTFLTKGSLETHKWKS